MTTGKSGELQHAAKRAADKIYHALIHHANVMSQPGVHYSSVADADDGVLEALNEYRESAERITGLSVLLRVPIDDDDDTWDDGLEMLAELADDDVSGLTEEVVLEARWHLTIADPQRVVTAARSDESITAGAVADPAGSTDDEVNDSAVQWALAALFERDVLWPPTGYAELGLTVNEMAVAVHPKPDED